MTPIPHELVTKSEMARRFGVTPAAVAIWTRDASFPPPLQMIGPNAIYDWRAVLDWVRENRRRSPLAS
jgi:hypothetical protein